MWLVPMSLPVKIVFAVWIGLAILALFMSFALGQTQECGPESGMLSRFKRTFQEVQIWTGNMGKPEQGISAILTQSGTGSWTWIICVKGGCCIKGGGTGGVFLRGA